MAFARTQHRAMQAKGNRCSVAILSAVVDAKAFHEVRLSASLMQWKFALQSLFVPLATLPTNDVQPDLAFVLQASTRSRIEGITAQRLSLNDCMHTKIPIDPDACRAATSTGRLPPANLVASLVQEAYDRFKGVEDGKVTDYIPALARVSPELFGICLVGVDGEPHSIGDVDYPFSIQS